MPEDTFRISLFPGLGMHVTKTKVVWFGKELGGNERGAFYEQLTHAQAVDRLTERMGQTITPEIGVVPAENQ